MALVGVQHSLFYIRYSLFLCF